MSPLLAQFSMFGDTATSMSSWQESELVAALLILVLGMALGILVTCLLVLLHFLGRSPRGRGSDAGRPSPQRERRALHSIYGIPERWLAIRSSNLPLVQSTLGLHNATPCSWEDGLSAVQDKKLFISPPIGGWILVIGSHLPDAAEDVDACFHFVTALSRKLGQVQYFSVNRALNHHGWAQAAEGRVTRAYAWAGTTLWNQGEPTKAETDLGITCLDYGASADRTDFDRSDPIAVNTERVPLLASRWSIDPSSVDARLVKEHRGVTGQLSRSKTH